MDRAVALGMPALALTDHGNLFGAIDFYNTAKSKGIKPLVGCELYLVETSRLEKHGRSDDEGKSIFHLGLLAKNLTGYQNLLKLVSDAHLKGFYYKPRTDLETLAKYANGLIGFTGCLASLVPQHLLHDREEEARKACARFVDIFGRENYFVEIQDHGIPEQLKIIPGLLKLAEEFNLKVIATNDVHYVNASDAGPHDAMLCIQTGAKIEEEKRMKFSGQEFYLKSRAEMEKLFIEVPESITNTQLVAEMCELTIPFPKGSERYPKYPLPIEVSAKTDRSGYLKDLCIAGLRRRYGLDYASPATHTDPVLGKTLVERLDFELSIISKTGFIDYFLVVWDFIDWARKHDIPVGPGRGSGAGCLVAYLLAITNLDPLRFKLLFERFLNPERVSPPDFDIDFCMRRRGQVIDYVREKYGKDCVANIITYGTLGAKMVIRDISRVHNLAYADADRLAKMIPDELNITLEDAVKKSTELRDEIARNPVAKKIFDQARVLEGMVRNTGKHAAGIIITDRPLDEFVPLTLQEEDVTVQFDMNAVGKLGLLKMDFLGLKTLTVIADAVDNIRRTADPKFDIEAISLEDAKTFALLNSGRTTGVFQLESGGMQNLCRQISLSTIDEIVALIALYRPGPMEWIPDYVRGKKDPSTVTYPHKLLEEVCRETYGIMVYQEQVMEAAKIIAGYTLGGADMLRRAMGKKDAEAMAKERTKFVEGAQRVNQIDEKTANSIFDILNKFAGYGFNKSHSAAYAILSYQTGFLKANYPVQFMAAMLSSELGNSEKVSHFVAECEAMGLKVLGPDVNESREMFTPVGEKIRFGLAGVKGVGELAAQKIIAERDAKGPYSSFDDFISRVEGRAI
jgi:DNA polymerase-3 subunit alpha